MEFIMLNNGILDDKNATVKDSIIHTTGAEQRHKARPASTSGVSADISNGGNADRVKSAAYDTNSSQTSHNANVNTTTNTVPTHTNEASSSASVNTASNNHGTHNHADSSEVASQPASSENAKIATPPAQRKFGTRRSDDENEELHQMAFPLFKAGHPYEAVALALNISPDYALKLYIKAGKLNQGKLIQAKYDLVKSGVGLKKLADGLFAGADRLKVTREGDSLRIEAFNPQYLQSS